MEISKVDGKLKRKGSKNAKRQRKYDSYVKHCQSDAVEKLREKPFALIYAERMKNESTQKTNER